jgi:prolipoprotein diacylglyceryltransferase
MYGFARFALEFIRTDDATIVMGMRANQLFAAIVIVVSAAILFYRQRKPVEVVQSE